MKKSLIFVMMFLLSAAFAQGVDHTNSSEERLIGTWTYSLNNVHIEIELGYNGNPHGINIVGAANGSFATYRGRWSATPTTITFILFSNMYNSDVMRYDAAGHQVVVGYELNRNTLTLNVIEEDDFISNIGIVGVTYRRK